MLEIVILYFLIKNIGSLAVKKGLPPLRWKLTMIGSWIIFELIGLFLAISFFGTGNLFGIMAIGLSSAFGGYLFVRYIMENKPDVDQLDDFGNNND